MDPAKSDDRSIGFGPLYVLKRLQAILADEDFDEGQVTLANQDVLKDLLREGWTDQDVRYMLSGLAPKDYRKSEWARVFRGSRWVACDVYHTCYDALHRRRHPKGIAVYLKFSVDNGGRVTILVASCHSSS